MPKLTDTSDAMDVIKKAVQSDPDYAWTWHCNVAVCSIDEGMNWRAANRAAARFMKIAFDVDTTKNRHYGAWDE